MAAGVWSAIGTALAQYASGPGKSMHEPPLLPVDGILIGPVAFSPALTMNSTYDSNIFKIEPGFDGDGSGPQKPQRPTSDTLLSARARLAFKLPFSHSFLSLVYRPQYSNYRTLEAPIKFSQQADFDSRLNFSNGSTLRVHDEFDDGYFEARSLNVDNSYQLSSTPYQRNTAGLDYDWAFVDLWGIAGSFQHINYNYHRTEVTNLTDTATGRGDTTDGRLDFFDYVSDTIETHGYRTFTRFQLFTGFSFGNSDQDRTEFNESQLAANDCVHPPVPDTPEHIQTCHDLANQIPSETITQRDLLIGIKGNLWARTQAGFRVGYTWWSFAKGSSEPFSGITLHGNVEHRFSSRTLGIMTLERSVNQATGDVTGYYLWQEIDLSAEHRLTMNLTGALSLGYRNRKYPGSGDEEPFSYQDIFGYVELRYRPGTNLRPSPVQFIATYAPQKTASDLPGLGSRANRVLFTVTCGWF